MNRKTFMAMAAAGLMAIVTGQDVKAKDQDTPLTKMVERAASGSGYLAFGDPDHSHLDVYNLVSHPEILKALSQKGYKSIAIEAPLYLQPVLDLYREGQISRLAFIHASDMVFDNAFIDDKTYLTMLAEFIDNAKQYNIRLYAVDGAPGMLSPENAMDFHSITSKMAVAWAKAISGKPEIGKMPAADRQKLLQTAIEPYNAEYMRVIAKEQQSQNKRRAQGMDITERYQHDADTASRIKDLSRFGKVTIIYGNLHLERNNKDRMGGDIDHHLGDNNVATINVYYDQKKYEEANGGPLWQRMSDPKSQPLFADEAPLWNKLKGAPDRPQYSLDLKQAIWTDESSGTKITVSLPRNSQNHKPSPSP